MARREGEKAVWLIVSKRIASGQNCFSRLPASPLALHSPHKYIHTEMTVELSIHNLIKIQNTIPFPP